MIFFFPSLSLRAILAFAEVPSVVEEVPTLLKRFPSVVGPLLNYLVMVTFLTFGFTSASRLACFLRGIVVLGRLASASCD